AGQAQAVRGCRGRSQRAGVAFERLHAVAGFEIEQVQIPLVVDGGERATRHEADAEAALFEDLSLLPPFEVPEADILRVAAGQRAFAIGADAETVDAEFPRLGTDGA